jgi:hypothetical protein
MLRKQQVMLKNQHSGAACLFALVVLAVPKSSGAAEALAPLAAIPLKLGDSYRLYVSARLNGSAFTCSIDSAGGNRISLDTGVAAAAGIQATSEGRTAGPQATEMVRDARARVTLELGGLTLKDQELVMGNRPTPGFECVIGMTVLRQYAVELTYYPPELRVFDGATYTYSGSGTAVPFTIEQRNPFVTVNLVFREGEPVTARLAVDTGGGRPAGYLTKSFVDGHQLMSRVSKAVPDFGSGMSAGRPRVLATRLESVKIGEIEMRRPIFFLWQAHGFGGLTEPDGLLCPDFLRRFKTVFDYPRQRLILEAGSRFGEEMAFDASGAALYRPSQGVYRVWKVIEGSPAAESGLKEGDTVMEMDGRAAAEMSLEEIERGLRAEGRSCELRVRRGADVILVKMKLRKLI